LNPDPESPLQISDPCYRYCYDEDYLNFDRFDDCPGDSKCLPAGENTCYPPYTCQNESEDLKVDPEEDPNDESEEQVCFQFCNDEESMIDEACPQGDKCLGNSISTCDPPWTCKRDVPLQDGDVCLRICKKSENDNNKEYIDRSFDCPNDYLCLNNGLGLCDPPWTCKPDFLADKKI